MRNLHHHFRIYDVINQKQVAKKLGKIEIIKVGMPVVEYIVEWKSPTTSSLIRFKYDQPGLCYPINICSPGNMKLNISGEIDLPR